MVSSWPAPGQGGELNAGSGRTSGQELDLRRGEGGRARCSQGDPVSEGTLPPMGPRALGHPRARLPWAPTSQAWKQGVSHPPASASVGASLLDTQQEAGV